MGTSGRADAMERTGKDHPHACGDKKSNRFYRFKVVGSSPRVWGQVELFIRVSYVHRIIPTRVGTSCCEVVTPMLPTDHPHACGDKENIIRIITITLGSSPRVWGQVRLCAHTEPSARIIPTRVGTSRVFVFIVQG